MTLDSCVFLRLPFIVFVLFFGTVVVRFLGHSDLLGDRPGASEKHNSPEEKHQNHVVRDAAVDLSGKIFRPTRLDFPDHFFFLFFGFCFCTTLV